MVGGRIRHSKYLHTMNTVIFGLGCYLHPELEIAPAVITFMVCGLSAQ